MSGMKRTHSMTAMLDRKKKPLSPATQAARAKMSEYARRGAERAALETRSSYGNAAGRSR